MSKQCNLMYPKLVDLVYEEAPMDEALKQHLNSCSHCRHQLSTLQNTMNILSYDSAPILADINLINISIDRFEYFKAVKKQRKNFRLFLSFTAWYMMTGLLIGYLFSVKTFFIIQAVIYFLAPLSALFMFKLSKAREV